MQPNESNTQIYIFGVIQFNDKYIELRMSQQELLFYRCNRSTWDRVGDDARCRLCSSFVRYGNHETIAWQVELKWKETCTMAMSWANNHRHWVSDSSVFINLDGLALSHQLMHRFFSSCHILFEIDNFANYSWFELCFDLTLCCVFDLLTLQLQFINRVMSPAIHIHAGGCICAAIRFRAIQLEMENYDKIVRPLFEQRQRNGLLFEICTWKYSVGLCSVADCAEHTKCQTIDIQVFQFEFQLLNWIAAAPICGVPCIVNPWWKLSSVRFCFSYMHAACDTLMMIEYLSIF